MYPVYPRPTRDVIPDSEPVVYFNADLANAFLRK